MPQTDPQVTKAIHAQQAEFEKLFNGRQLDRLTTSYYAEDAAFLAPGAPTATGKAQVKATLEQVASMFSDVRIKTGDVQVSGDLAVTHGTYKAKLKLATGTVDDQGKFFEAWRKERDGTWKCIIDSFSSDLDHIA